MSKPISLKKNTIANYIGQFYNMFIGIAILPAYMIYLGAEAFGLIGFRDSFPVKNIPDFSDRDHIISGVF